MSELVLIVDDDPVQRRLLEEMIQRFGYRTVVVEGGDEAVKLLVDNDAVHPEVIILDLVMPDLDGLGVLARMRDAKVSIPVIVQTAHGGIDNVVSAMRGGATDFVVKPASAERLQVSIRNALATSALASELQRLKREQEDNLSVGDVITRSPGEEFPGAAVLPLLIEPSPALTPSPDDSDSHSPSIVRNLKAAGQSLPLTDPRGDVRPLEDIERETIRFAISHYRGQMSEVARRLKIGRSTLYRKLEGLGLDEDLPAA
jgi:DNA-binding NtrC family response regulator